MSNRSAKNLLRLLHFKVEERTRQLTQIDLMIGEFTVMTEELDRQITLEEKRAGMTDPTHFAYPTFAKAARQRRDNLQGSIADLRDKRFAAEDALAEAESELRKAQALESRDVTPSAERALERQVERRVMLG